MLPESVPLLSSATLKAAALNKVQADAGKAVDASPDRSTQSSAATTTATNAEATRQSATQNFNARVISSIATDDGYRLTLEGQDSSGKPQTLQVNSQSPLPRNTVLTLQLSEDADGQMRLSVTDIKLPPQSGSLSDTSASIIKQAAAALLANLQNNGKATGSNLPGSNNQPLPTSTQTPLPVPPISTATKNSASTILNAKQAAPLPALLSQFLASRIPLLTSSAAMLLSPSTTSQSLSADLNAPASNVYTNPARRPPVNTAATAAQTHADTAGKHLTPQTGSSHALQQLLQQPSLPASVRMPLQQWLNNLPQIPQLQQPAALRESVLNSGLMYENKVLSLLQDALSAPLNSKNAATPPATQPATTPAASAGNDSSSLFRSLWARTGLSQTVAQLQTPQTALQTDSRLNNSAAQTPPAAPADALTAALQATRERLEKTAEAPAPAVSHNLLQQIEHLLHSDSKAAMGKALLAWLQIIAQNSGKDGQFSAPRELPLSLPAALRDNLPDGFRLLHSALAQLEVDQAQRLQNGNDSNLNIPLYFRDDQQPKEIRLQLQKEETSSSDNEQKKTIRWRLKLHFELQQLGPLDVELDMTLPQVAATFWSEQQDTLAQLQRSLQPLRSRLQQMGVDVSELRARHGRLPETTRNSIRHSLVDVHS